MESIQKKVKCKKKKKYNSHIIHKKVLISLKINE